MAQDNAEDVRAPTLAVRLKDRRSRTKVDLGFFARLALHPAERQWAGLAKAPYETSDTVILGLEAVLAEQVLVDPPRGQTFVELAFNQ